MKPGLYMWEQHLSGHFPSPRVGETGDDGGIRSPPLAPQATLWG